MSKLRKTTAGGEFEVTLVGIILTFLGIYRAQDDTLVLYPKD